MALPQIIFHPIISYVQKVALYETKTTFYLIGSNNTQTKFRVLKIDRTEPRDLIVVDDKIEYNTNEIHDLVRRIETGNKSKSNQRLGNLGRVVSAFGIVVVYYVGIKYSRDLVFLGTAILAVKAVHISENILAIWVLVIIGLWSAAGIIIGFEVRVNDTQDGSYPRTHGLP